MSEQEKVLHQFEQNGVQYAVIRKLQDLPDDVHLLRRVNDRWEEIEDEHEWDTVVDALDHFLSSSERKGY